MASALFGIGRNHFAEGDILWKTSGGSTINCLLVDTGVENPYSTIDTIEHLDDITATALIPNANTGTADYTDALAEDVTLGNPTATLGVCDADDITFCTVASTEASVEGLVLYKFVTDETASIMIAWVEFSAVTPNGGDITIQWDSGANKIFKL
jgi:hypothetical protein